MLTWHDVLSSEKQQDYFINILKTLSVERASGIIIYPSQKDIFNAFRLTNFCDIKVVILGQDPYHGPDQAHGLAFSVRPNITIPPSLLNIYRELERSISNFKRPSHGYLESWAQQGVLLLNTILTVRAGQSHSHAKLGWETFTDKVISIINKYRKGIVFLLWGSHAQKKGILIDEQRHYVLKAPHPSPLSVHRIFSGCNHFVLANRWLEKHDKKVINWTPVLPFKENNSKNDEQQSH